MNHKDNKDFIVASAAYEIMRGNEAVVSGDCIIDGHNVSMIIQLDEPGFYELCLIYTIAAEIRRPRYTIKVG